MIGFVKHNNNFVKTHIFIWIFQHVFQRIKNRRFNSLTMLHMATSKCRKSCTGFFLYFFAFLKAFYFKPRALLHKHLQLRVARWKYCIFAIMNQPQDKESVKFCRPCFSRNVICTNLSCNQTGLQGLEVHRGGCFCKISPAAKLMTHQSQIFISDLWQCTQNSKESIHPCKLLWHHVFFLQSMQKCTVIF